MKGCSGGDEEAGGSGGGRTDRGIWGRWWPLQRLAFSPSSGLSRLSSRKAQGWLDLGADDAPCCHRERPRLLPGWLPHLERAEAVPYQVSNPLPIPLRRSCKEVQVVNAPAWQDQSCSYFAPTGLVYSFGCYVLKSIDCIHIYINPSGFRFRYAEIINLFCYFWPRQHEVTHSDVWK